MFSKKLLTGAALTALAMSMGGTAHAQSTAGQIDDEPIVVTGTRTSTGGVISAEQAGRARATVTQDYLDQQNAGQTILNSINLVPGVNFTNNDAYGASGGNITMRGFDGARISLTFDGIPLNDTGNYAIYSNQQLDPELITRANVNMGTTDVDSPTASATGGTVNYVTRVPAEEFGLMVQPTVGDHNYFRLFGMVDTGPIGPWGTTMWGAASYQVYDQFIGPGELERQQYNFRIYQGLGGGDFISAAFHYNENRNHFYRNFNLATFNSGVFPVNDATCTRLAGGPGAQIETISGATPLCTNYYNVRINPSNTGNIRLQSRFSLTDNITLTVDPSFQYTRANGGGIEAVFENDVRLRGASLATGVDLNGDGDVVDRVQLYSPSNTNTYRYGITTSLIWDINDNHRLRFGYTYDYGRHRQTGEYSLLSQTGDPGDVFGGRDGFGTPILTAEGDVFQKRDRFSIASLSQWNIEYRGDFLNDALTVTIGVRAPMFERELNQNCYSVKGSTSSTQFCTTATPTPSPVSPGFFRFTGTTDYAPAFAADVEYDDILPNLGLVYRFGENQQVFLSYAEGLSAPRTDDLYGGILPTQLSTVFPETTRSYDFGYRYQGDRFMLAATAWMTEFENRIIRSQDPLDPTVSFARNVGAVDLYGYDIAAAYQVNDDFLIYASAAYSESELQNNLPGQVVGRGNRLVDSPLWTYSARGEYEMGPFLFGLQARWVDERFSNDFNTEVVEAYTLVDLDLRWNLGTSWNNENTYLQLNVTNLFDEEYLSTISSGSNGGTGFFGLGAPRTATLSLRVEF